jgi:hypothetical protein
MPEGPLGPPTPTLKICNQIVFAVEGRQDLIDPTHDDELQKYITGRHKLMAE